MADHERTEEMAARELAAPRDTLPDDPVASVTHPEFPVVLRGYDRAAVDAYAEKVVRLVSELHATVSPRAAIREALDRVARETADILRRAHEAAEETTRRSRAEADDRVEAARREAEQLARDAAERLQRLDRDADLVWQERAKLLADVGRIATDLDRVRASADERMPPEPVTPSPPEPVGELPAPPPPPDEGP
jgi:cell division septum initiation protein DivIVA